MGNAFTADVEKKERCYLCGGFAHMCDPHTQSRQWVSGIKYTTPCGNAVALSAHTGCLMYEKHLSKKERRDL